jgi:hypothetical protein
MESKTMCNDDIIKHQQALIKRLYNEMHEEWSAEMIISCYQEINKDIRQNKIHEERKQYREKQSNTIIAPSEKQIAYAKKLGIEKPESYSKYDLSKEIDKKQGSNTK